MRAPHQLACLALITAIKVSTAYGEETVSYFTPDGATHITFDAKKISKEKLSKYLEVGPDQESGFWIPRCDLSPSARLESFEENCTRVILHLKSKQKDLDQFKKDKELLPVVQLLKKWGEFSIYISNVALGFSKNPTVKTLKTPYKGINPAVHCDKVITKIEGLPDLRLKLEAVTTDYLNCMNAQFRKKDVNYPLDAWNKFLKSLPITVKHEEPTEDRD